MYIFKIFDNIGLKKQCKFTILHRCVINFSSKPCIQPFWFFAWTLVSGNVKRWRFWIFEENSKIGHCAQFLVKNGQFWPKIGQNWPFWNAHWVLQWPSHFFSKILFNFFQISFLGCTLYNILEIFLKLLDLRRSKI